MMALVKMARGAGNILLLAAILSGAGLSAGGFSPAREATIGKICRTHRLNCNELKQAVQSVAETGKLPEKWITKKQDVYKRQVPYSSTAAKGVTSARIKPRSMSL